MAAYWRYSDCWEVRLARLRSDPAICISATLDNPLKARLVEAGLLPTEAASLTELGAMLELVDPQREPVLLMGDLNACTATLAPLVEGWLPPASIDTVLNAQGYALLSLLAQQQLLMLSSIIQLFHSTTSLSGASPDSA